MKKITCKTLFAWFCLTTILLCWENEIKAQQVKASMDSTAILVGHQTQIKLEVVQDKGKTVLPPTWKDTLVKGIEILKVSTPDTTDLNDAKWQINSQLLVTSFDSGFYYIPPFKFIDGDDTLESNSLSLKVVTLDIDTTGAEFFDIKPVMKAPFVWKDYLMPVLWVLLALLVIAAAIYIYYRYKKHKPLLGSQPVVPLLPAHVRALQALEKVKDEKLWQNNREKEYYTQVTDILRQYIFERFRINALEMTSSEILGKIKVLHDYNSVYDNLKQILVTADFVKFAKWKPLPDENEVSMVNAMLFVSQTKEEEPEPENNEQDSESVDKGNDEETTTQKENNSTANLK